MEDLIASALQLLNEDFLAFMPAPAANAIRMIAGLCFLFSILAARSKPLLGEPSPHDPEWKRRLFSVMHWVDIFAVNSSTIRDKKLIHDFRIDRDSDEIAEVNRRIDRDQVTFERQIDQANMAALLQDAEDEAMTRLEAGDSPEFVEDARFRREQRIRAMSPARRRIERAEVVAVQAAKHGRGPGLRTLLFVALVSSSINAACAGSQLRTHAVVADAAYQPLLAAKHAIETRAEAQAAGVRQRAASPDDERRQMAALQASYLQVETAFDALLSSYNAYVEAIKNAHASGGDISPALALALLSRWQSFLEAARAMGLTVPDPPEALRELGRQS